MTTSLPPPPPLDFPAEVPFDVDTTVHDRNVYERLICHAEYLAKKAAVKYAKDFAKDHGYAISVTRSKKSGKRLYSSVREVVYLACAKAGSTRHRTPDSGAYASSKTGCPFQLRLVLRHNSWAIDCVNSSHNHN